MEKGRFLKLHSTTLYKYNQLHKHILFSIQKISPTS